MAEGQVLIKDLPEATSVSDSSYIPVDNGTLTQKISVENFNDSSNQTAKGYAEQAQAAATTATEAIADVNSKVDAAQAQANIAATQAGYAQTYAGNAQTYAGNAQGYANTAQGSATNAAASASAASSSADAANDNATLARSWAEGNTGAREGENTNNARYWANKAQSAAQITIDDHLDPQSTNPVENKVIYNALNDMHTGGSNIEITTTQTSLYGKDVTISDGTTTVTETFDLTGKALFEGVLMTGDLTIESTDGTQTARASLTVPYFGNYSKGIAFWSATIDVTTTTTQFDGLTVSAKKNGVVMGSGTFNTDYGKNLCPATASTQTINGVTYTVNADGSVTVNGTATNNSIFKLHSYSISEFNEINARTLILNGCPTGGGGETYRLDVISGTETAKNLEDTGSGITIPANWFSEGTISVRLRIGNGTSVNNLTFYPMLRLASDPDDTYVPYHDPITSASITVPEAGTYTLEVTLDWKTYTSSPFSVTEETTYNETIDGYIAPISLTTPTSEFYGQSISVTRNGVALPVSLAFDNTGAASFTALDEGTYLFTLTYGGEAYTATVTVSAETSYSAVIKMWTATVNISTTSSVLQLQQIVVKKSGVQVGTTQFNAAGTASYIAHETGTYTFECTYDSYPFSSDPVVITDETTYSTTITAFTATLNITTTSTELYSQTITIKKGSTTIGTTAFSSSGSASYRVHEIGIYTAECTYSGDTYYSDAVSVSAETTYPMSIDIVTTPDGKTVTPTDDIQIWLACADITDKTYTTLSEVLADHETLYRLMANDNAVDYLVRSTTWASGITADEYAMKYIGKWNYASDILLSDSTWREAICNSTYFESVLNTKVPIMTSDTTPSGIAKAEPANDSHPAWNVFDGNDSTYGQATDSAPRRLSYKFTQPVAVYKTVFLTFNNAAYWGKTQTLQYSDDGTNWINLNGTTTAQSERSIITNSAIEGHLYWGVSQSDYFSSLYTLQFYGRIDVTEGLIDIYSAANDTVYYMDNGSPVTVCTTDGTGHGTVAKSSLPNGTYTLYSTVNQTSKTVTVTDGTSEIDLT